MRVVPVFLAMLITASLQQAFSQTVTPSTSMQIALDELKRCDASKFASGRLYLRTLDILHEAIARPDGSAVAGMGYLPVVIYTPERPDARRLAELEAFGVRSYLEYWTPASDNHPNGFFLAELPAVRVAQIIGLAWIAALGDAGTMYVPKNNEAARSIGADRAWLGGYTGKGVRVGVLDSGIDLTPPQADLPVPIGLKDYSHFPRIDDDVRNRVTAHGTHVAGSVLGRGVLSAENIGSGGGAYRGMAPASDLVFMKIGNDSNATASDPGIIAALHDMVAVHKVRVINMSYGGWSAYHDGSEALDQKADWCFDNGAAVFFSAGNSRDDGKHYSTYVDAHSESDFIEVRYSVPAGTTVRPSFNLVWFDGPGIVHQLSLRYFDQDKREITRLNIAPVTESPRGTQSQYSSTVDTLAPGDAVRFVKIVNASDVRQFAHVYEDMHEGTIWFVEADPGYTIGSPATADRVMAVAAYTTRSSYLDHTGSRWQYGQKEEEIASFSSLGPRADGVMKPDIAAPGSAIISVRDRDVLPVPNKDCVDSDGSPGGAARYQVMQGTSMASPVCAGAAALLLEKYPNLTPGQVYDSLRVHARRDLFTGTTPNRTWGSGKLDVRFLTGIAGEAPVWSKASASLPVDSPPVAGISVHTSGSVYVVTEEGQNADPALYRSDNIGASWTKILTKPSLAGLCLLKDGSIVVAEPDARTLHRSVDAGTHWTATTMPGDASDLRRSPGDSLLLAATHSSGPLVSSDIGATWSSAAGNLPPATDLRCIEGGPQGWVFAAVMDGGKYRLYRGHRANWEWERKDGGIHQNESVMDIRVLSDGTLLAITERRSYRSPDLGGWWYQTDILNGENHRLYVAGDALVFIANRQNAIHRSTDGGMDWETYSSGLEHVHVAAIASGAGKAWCAEGTDLYSCPIPLLPGIVALNSPADGAGSVGASPLCTWSAASNAATYDVQFGREPELKEVLLEARGHPGTSINPKSLQQSGEYYWRVRGKNAAGSGPWSESRYFTTGNALPSVPILISPLDDDVPATPAPSLIWRKARRAVSYDLQVSSEPEFAHPVAQIQSSADTVWTFSAAESGVPYFWRVRARNAQGISDWSRIRMFRSAAEPGDAGYALMFDDRGDLVTVPHSSGFDEIEAADEMTAEAWVRVHRYDNGFFPILDKYKPDIDWGWQFSVTQWGMDLNFIWKGVGCTTPIQLNTWQHVAVSYKRSEGVARFFIDGVQVEEQPCDADIPDVESQYPLLIGNGPSGGDEQAFGIIDEVRLWKVARSEAEILSTMNQRLTGNENGLVLCMHFDEGAGSVTQDGSGHASASALVQSPVWVVSEAPWGPPAAPRLLLPAPDATNQFQQPLLRWSAVSGAESYHVQISTNASFTSFVAEWEEAQLPETRPPVDLAGNTKHYWRVRAENARASGSWSAVGSFTTLRVPPPPPRLLSPLNGDTTVSIPAQLRWTSAIGASGYRIQVSSEADFTRLVLDSAGIMGTTATVSGIEANTTYYWQVAATSAAGSSTWSETWQFSAVVKRPGVPVLISPRDSSQDLDAPVTLSWQAVPSALRYHVQVADAESFTAPLLVDAGGLSSPTYLLGTLAPEKRYYWRARAGNLAGDGDWSEVWSFTTRRVELGAPVLLLPPDRATGVAALPALVWSSVNNAKSYTMECADNMQFTMPFARIDSHTDTAYTFVGSLTQGIWYYWRVRANGEHVSGSWSATGSFRVLRPYPSKIIQLLPDVDAVNQLEQPLLVWQQSNHVDSFRVQLAAEANMINILFDNVTTDSSLAAGPFLAGSVWYWRVRGENERGAGVWSDVRGFTVRTGTAVAHPGDASDFLIRSLYPHPVENVLTVGINAPFGTPIEVRVFDLLGREKMRARAINSDSGVAEIAIRLSGMVSGWYLLHVEAAHLRDQRRFLLLR